MPIAIRTLLILALVALLPLPASAEPLLPEAGARQVAVRVAPGVHVLHQAEVFQPAPIGNVTVIEQTDGLVLVDTGGSRGEGERVVALVRGISLKPVKAVVITHWHNDHPLGLSAILATWPDADVISTFRAAQDIRTGLLGDLPTSPDPAWDAARTARMLELADEYTAQADDPGLTDEERRGWLGVAAVARMRAADFPGTYIVAPSVTFTDRLLIDDPASPVEIIQPGRANTDGAAVVWLPRQRVLVAGDIVVSPIPFAFNVYPAEWMAVIDELKDYDFEVLVPGHGLPMRDRAYLDRLLGAMTEVRARVAALVAAGRTPEEVAAEADFEAQRALFAGDSNWRRRWFDRYWLTPFLSSADREARGERLGTPPESQE